MKVTVRCDECKGLVKGMVMYQDGYTAGFYLRGWVVVPNKGTQADLFPEGSQNILCDYDMQKSDSYRRVYGDRDVALDAAKGQQREPDEGEVVRSYDELMGFFKEGGRWPVVAAEPVYSDNAKPPEGRGGATEPRGGATEPRGGATEPRGGVERPPTDEERLGL